MALEQHSRELFLVYTTNCASWEKKLQDESSQSESGSDSIQILGVNRALICCDAIYVINGVSWMTF